MYSPLNPMQGASGPLPWSQINGCLSHSQQPSSWCECFRSPLLFDHSETSVDLQRDRTERAVCQITESSPNRRWRIRKKFCGELQALQESQKSRITASTRQRTDLCSGTVSATGSDSNSWPPGDQKKRTVASRNRKLLWKTES